MEEDNGFKILICSDTHLGAHEKSKELQNDCYLAFEEILQKAEENEIDFIIHGGDFFDEQNPTKWCLTQTMNLMRKYLNGKPKNDYRVIYSMNENEDNSFSYNQGIKYPMYCIHGNHDIPSGIENISGLDILQTTGLINFIGKDINNTINENNENNEYSNEILQLTPIIFIKNETRIALYGMSYKQHKEMHEIWAKGKVSIIEPEGEYFKILVVHQDVVKHNEIHAIPKELLLKHDFNLVIFGHEHECIIQEGENKFNLEKTVDRNE